MERNEILRKINSVFGEVLDNSTLILNEKTQAADVEDWDSLTHIQLVVAVEKKFRIRFTSKEIQSWKNVGEMIGSIESKFN